MYRSYWNVFENAEDSEKLSEDWEEDGENDAGGMEYFLMLIEFKYELNFESLFGTNNWIGFITLM